MHMSSSKEAATLVDFNENLNFRDRVSKNTQISKLIKIRPVGAELFHRTDGQTDGQIRQS
jgi:hypothetical protein